MSDLSMKQFLRSQFIQHAPRLFYFVQAVRRRGQLRTIFEPLHAEVKQVLYPNGTTVRVLSGPFKGMKYIDEIVWGSITPKWLGSWEAELHPLFDFIRQEQYVLVIDVGAAEGYYAAGLAYMLPNAHVIAFDIDFISRRQTRRMAQLNNLTERLTVKTWCSPSSFDTSVNGKTLVVCDIEGAEKDLLDPTLAKSLLRADILVELHHTEDKTQEEMEALLQSRFSATHTINRIVAAQDREDWIQANYAAVCPTIPASLMRKATDENRGNGRVWFWMKCDA